jgi:hypothetical protein
MLKLVVKLNGTKLNKLQEMNTHWFKYILLRKLLDTAVVYFKQ